jgi:transcriptional regulator with XRE-family HTH domain
MTNQPRVLPQALRTARTERGLTQQELATRIGVSQGTISFWENGTETPTIEHVILLALVLPEIVNSFEGRARELLQRVLRLERELYGGRCACTNCSCAQSTT